MSKRITGYLIPFADRMMPVCRDCTDGLGWFPLENYRGTVEVVHDLIDGLYKITEHQCANCDRLFRGGEKHDPRQV